VAMGLVGEKEIELLKAWHVDTANLLGTDGSWN